MTYEPGKVNIYAVPVIVQIMALSEADAIERFENAGLSTTGCVRLQSLEGLNCFDVLHLSDPSGDATYDYALPLEEIEGWRHDKANQPVITVPDDIRERIAGESLQLLARSLERTTDG